MLQPSRVQHRKVHKGRMKKTAFRGTQFAFGAYGLKEIGRAHV
jgi:ribosomal protein L16/L10AE